MIYNNLMYKYFMFKPERNQKMQARIDELRVIFKNALAAATDADALEALRIDFLGKKGQIAELMKGLRDVADKKAAGQLINGLKTEVEDAITEACRSVFRRGGAYRGYRGFAQGRDRGAGKKRKEVQSHP